MPLASRRLQNRVLSLTEEIDALLQMLDGLDREARRCPLGPAERTRAEAAIAQLRHVLSRSRSARRFAAVPDPLRPSALLVLLLQAHLALAEFIVTHSAESAGVQRDNPLPTHANSAS